MTLKLLALLAIFIAVHSGYWLAKRHSLRIKWHAGQLNAGEFFDGMRGAPPWIEKSTAWYGDMTGKCGRK